MKVISNQKALPSWEYIDLRTELILAGRYAYLNSGGGADAARFKALALEELKLLRQRSKSRDLKWNAIRKEIGLQLRDHLTSRERKAIEAFKKKILPEGRQSKLRPPPLRRVLRALDSRRAGAVRGIRLIFMRSPLEYLASVAE